MSRDCPQERPQSLVLLFNTNPPPNSPSVATHLSKRSASEPQPRIAAQARSLSADQTTAGGGSNWARSLGNVEITAAGMCPRQGAPISRHRAIGHATRCDSRHAGVTGRINGPGRRGRVRVCDDGRVSYAAKGEGGEGRRWVVGGCIARVSRDRLPGRETYRGGVAGDDERWEA